MRRIYIGGFQKIDLYKVLEDIKNKEYIEISYWDTEIQGINKQIWYSTAILRRENNLFSIIWDREGENNPTIEKFGSEKFSNLTEHDAITILKKFRKGSFYMVTDKPKEYFWKEKFKTIKEEK